MSNQNKKTRDFPGFRLKAEKNYFRSDAGYYVEHIDPLIDAPIRMESTITRFPGSDLRLLF